MLLHTDWQTIRPRPLSFGFARFARFARGLDLIVSQKLFGRVRAAHNRIE